MSNTSQTLESREIKAYEQPPWRSSLNGSRGLKINWLKSAICGLNTEDSKLSQDFTAKLNHSLLSFLACLRVVNPNLQFSGSLLCIKLRRNWIFGRDSIDEQEVRLLCAIRFSDIPLYYVSIFSFLPKVCYGKGMMVER